MNMVKVFSVEEAVAGILLLYLEMLLKRPRE